MTAYKLKIVTPDGLLYDGAAEKLIVRTVGGEVCILANHIDYVAPLGMGRAVVENGGIRRTAACIGGMLRVGKGEVTLVPTTFEWADQIDTSRAEASQHKAEAVLQNKDATNTEIQLAEARLKRALIRKSVAQNRIMP